MVKELLELANGTGEMKSHMTSLGDSIESHYLALAAEKSRVNGGKVVKLEEMR
jgi:hypothetical protein